MDLLRRISETLRQGGRDEHRDPAAVLTTVHWRHRVMAADVERDLEELADERAYVEAEIARSRATVVQLESDAAAAEADGCAGIAAVLREERMQTDVFLAELAEVRQAITDEQTRLLGLRHRLAGSLADDEAAARTTGVEAVGEDSAEAGI